MSFQLKYFLTYPSQMQMSSRERSLRATNDELLVSLEEVTRQLEQSRNAENRTLASGKTEE